MGNVLKTTSDTILRPFTRTSDLFYVRPDRIPSPNLPLLATNAFDYTSLGGTVVAKFGLQDVPLSYSPSESEKGWPWVKYSINRIMIDWLVIRRDLYNIQVNLIEPKSYYRCIMIKYEIPVENVDNGSTNHQQKQEEILHPDSQSLTKELSPLQERSSIASTTSTKAFLTIPISKFIPKLPEDDMISHMNNWWIFDPALVREKYDRIGHNGIYTQHLQQIFDENESGLHLHFTRVFVDFHLEHGLPQGYNDYAQVRLWFNYKHCIQFVNDATTKESASNKPILDIHIMSA